MHLLAMLLIAFYTLARKPAQRRCPPMSPQKAVAPARTSRFTHPKLHAIERSAGIGHATYYRPACCSGLHPEWTLWLSFYLKDDSKLFEPKNCISWRVCGSRDGRPYLLRSNSPAEIHVTVYIFFEIHHI